jgi:tRNA A-37 threonylcarbamoyl transferase component Bud32
MLSLDDAASYLLARHLIDPDWIIGGSLSIRSVARRNGNLKIEGPPGAGLLIKQPGDHAASSRATLSAEAAFYQFCQNEPAAAGVAEIVPSLVDHDAENSILALRLVSDAVTLSAFLKPKADQRSAIEVARSLGAALASVHRTFRAAEMVQCPRLAWLSRAAPWAMSLHRPTPQVLSILSPANADLIRMLQTEEGCARELDSLLEGWRAEAVIHGDFRPDNVLVRKGHAEGPWEVLIIDWEMVQLGDPAWDLAGALQAFVRSWVLSIPMTADLSIDERAAQAKFPFENVQALCRSLWQGYQADLEADRVDRRHLLDRAVKLTAVRLIQSAYEISHELTVLDPRSVIMLQLSWNVFVQPELALAQLFGITGSAALS